MRVRYIYEQELEGFQLGHVYSTVLTFDDSLLLYTCRAVYDHTVGREVNYSISLSSQVDIYKFFEETE